MSVVKAYKVHENNNNNNNTELSNYAEEEAHCSDFCPMKEVCDDYCDYCNAKNDKNKIEQAMNILGRFQYYSSNGYFVEIEKATNFACYIMREYLLLLEENNSLKDSVNYWRKEFNIAKATFIDYQLTIDEKNDEIKELNIRLEGLEKWHREGQNYELCYTTTH